MLTYTVHLWVPEWTGGIWVDEAHPSHPWDIHLHCQGTCNTTDLHIHTKL